MHHAGEMRWVRRENTSKVEKARATCGTLFLQIRYFTNTPYNSLRVLTTLVHVLKYAV